MPTARKAAADRARAADHDTFAWAVIASIIWVSMRRTGLSVIIGSWKIIASLRPRQLRSVSSGAPTSSSPSSRIDPSTMWPGGSTKPMIDQPVTVLPEPDSPTRPSTSPASRPKLTPSTALATPLRVKKCVRRFSTARTAMASLPFQPGVHHVAQLVAHEIERDDGDDQREAGIERDPVMAGQHVGVAVGDQQPERRLGDRNADAEERQRRLERDGVRDLHGGDHDQRRERVGQEMAEDDARLRQSKPA